MSGSNRVVDSSLPLFHSTGAQQKAHVSSDQGRNPRKSVTAGTRGSFSSAMQKVPKQVNTNQIAVPQVLQDASSWNSILGLPAGEDGKADREGGETLVDPYVLPRDRIAAKSGALPVSYVGDCYDSVWLKRYNSLEIVERFQDASGGKGGKGGKLPHRSGGQSAGGGGCAVAGSGNLTMGVLEAVFTLFEKSAIETPSISLERVAAKVTSSTVAELTKDGKGLVTEKHLTAQRGYWVQKRKATGCSLIPELASVLPQRDSDGKPYCDDGILGDCPLPFAVRNWEYKIWQPTEPLLRKGLTEAELYLKVTQDIAAERQLREEEGNNSRSFDSDTVPGMGIGIAAFSTAADGLVADNLPDRSTRKRMRSPNGNDGTKIRSQFIVRDTQRMFANAHALMDALVEREELKVQHTELALYELAMIRGYTEPSDTAAPSTRYSAPEQNTDKDAQEKLTQALFCWQPTEREYRASPSPVVKQGLESLGRLV